MAASVHAFEPLQRHPARARCTPPFLVPWHARTRRRRRPWMVTAVDFPAVRRLFTVCRRRFRKHAAGFVSYLIAAFGVTRRVILSLFATTAGHTMVLVLRRDHCL